jgi:hypothetical protein
LQLWRGEIILNKREQLFRQAIQVTEIFKIGGKTLSVSDYHHEVLTHWSMIKREAPERELFTLTLDHHTDVVEAFRGNRRVSSGAWQDEKSVADAVGKLKHDEHIDWAVKSGLICAAAVVAHVDSTKPASDKIVVRRDSRFPDEIIQLNQPDAFRPLADRVLEDDFLEPLLKGFPLERDFILDIDCDNFFSKKSLAPDEHRIFDALVRNCCGISISKESDYVRILQFSGEKLTGDGIAEQLVGYIQTLLA